MAEESSLSPRLRVTHHALENVAVAYSIATGPASTRLSFSGFRIR